MRIAIDLQGCQSEGSRTRGIGRYSTTLIKTLITSSEEHEIILVSNKSMHCIKDKFFSLISEHSHRVKYFEWGSPRVPNSFSKSIDNYKFVSKQIKSYAYSLLNADIILITSFFEGFLDEAVIEFDINFDLPPIASIFYDLIPLINPAKYLDTNPDFKKFYLNKVLSLENLDCLLSISNSSAREARKYLDIKTDKIFTIFAGFDSSIFNTFEKDFKSSNNDIYTLGKYILYSGAGDPRKNLERLIEAFSLLDRSLILAYKLVLVGKLLPEEISMIKSWISLYGIPTNQVKLLGFVSDDELAYLYQNTSLFVFPSLHEGFGLPALEAIACGAVVIGSNVTSIPEIISNDNALFNPLDVYEISSLMKKSLTNIEFRNSLLMRAHDTINKFSWFNTVEKMIESFSQIIYKKNKNIQILDKQILYENLIIKKEKNYNLLIKNISNFLINTRFKNKLDYFLQQISSIIDILELQSNYFKEFSISDFKNISWRIEGPYDSNYSLAILNREFAIGMNSLTDRLSILSSEGTGDYVPNSYFLDCNTKIKKLHDYSKVDVRPFLVQSRNMYPPRVNDMQARFCILHAYGWEETEIPYSWISDFNAYLDGITVMSSQVKKTLIDCGFEKPIDICALGVDHLSVSKSPVVLQLKAKKFKFLHISSCFPRKGIIALLDAYQKAFDIYDDVSLIIKTFDNLHNNIDALLENYKQANPFFPHVIVIKDNYSQLEIISLYRYCDVYLAPSHGEGFGLPIAEAMLFSIPVITTSWGGQNDFVNDDNAWLLDYDFSYSESHFNLCDSVWASPSSDNLSQIMKHFIIENKDIIRQKTKVAKNFVVKNLNWSNVAEKNYEFIQNLSKFKSNKLPVVGFITTWNTRCGIASYCDSLLSNFKHKYKIFAPYADEKISNDLNNVERCWETDKKFDSRLINSIIKNKVTTVVIQFNYGFFDFKSFSQLIEECLKNKIKVLVFLHSTIDPKNNPDKSLSLIVNTLKKCDRLLVHTVKDLNRLKCNGIVDNVSIFPHGINFFKQDKLSMSSNIWNLLETSKKVKYKIATTGFCLPNKGFLELIKAISMIRSQGYDVHLTILAPSYGNISDNYSLQIKDLIKELNISYLINHDLSYHSNKDINQFLSYVDLVVYPYQESNESSSASVRQGLSSKTPVIVTPISIFDDVSDVVSTFVGVDEKYIAEGIMSCLGIGDSSKCIEQPNISDVKSWKECHHFSVLSKRLESMIKGLEVNSEFSRMTMND